MTRRSPLFWLMVPVFMAVGLATLPLIPDSFEEHRLELAELFHLPDDVVFTGFHSPYGRGGLSRIAGVVQFTPEQWDTYVATLDDPSAWDPHGFAFRGVTVTASAPAEALRWHDGEQAWVTEDYRSFWLDWGLPESDAPEAEPSAGSARAWRSMCWVVLDEGAEQRIVPCRDYRLSPRGRRFYVRARLERDTRSLSMVVR